MLVPPVVAGGVHDKVMQFLKALITLGADGGPGYAEKVNNVFYAPYRFMHEQDFNFRFLFLFYCQRR